MKKALFSAACVVTCCMGDPAQAVPASVVGLPPPPADTRCKHLPEGMIPIRPGSCTSLSKSKDGNYEIVDWKETAHYCELTHAVPSTVPGGRLNQKGQFLNTQYMETELMGWVPPSWVAREHIKPCSNAQVLDFQRYEAQKMLILVRSVQMGISPAGGPVHVRGHRRCNASKCWSVRSYWRSR